MPAAKRGQDAAAKPRRGIRELKNLPAAANAFASAVKPPTPAGLFVPSASTAPVSSASSSRSTSAGRAVADVSDDLVAVGAAAPPSDPRGVELARIFSAVGSDLVPHAPDVALAFLQRALSEARAPARRGGV